MLCPAPGSAGPPVIMGPKYVELEEDIEKTVDLSCNAIGFPAPSIVWTTSDGEVPAIHG